MVTPPSPLMRIWSVINPCYSAQNSRALLYHDSLETKLAGCIFHVPRHASDSSQPSITNTTCVMDGDQTGHPPRHSRLDCQEQPQRPRPPPVPHVEISRLLKCLPLLDSVRLHRGCACGTPHNFSNDPMPQIHSFRQCDSGNSDEPRHAGSDVTIVNPPRERTRERGAQRDRGY